MTLEIKTNTGIPLGAYIPGTGSSGGGGSTPGGGGGSSTNSYSKEEIDAMFAEFENLIADVTGDKAEYVDLINEINGDV